MEINIEEMHKSWMEWEKGNISPGDLMKTFKISGMREMLELAIEQTAKEQAGNEAVSSESSEKE